MQSLHLPTLKKTKEITVLVINWLQTNRKTILLCTLALYLLAKKNITLEISLNNDKLTSTTNNRPSLNKSAVKTSLTTVNKPLTQQQKLQLAYVKRFAKVAQGEMHKYGIPASIKLAQGLLESNAGKSPLATKNNNHFGIKCFSKKCKKGHCSNFSDDSHKDFFRVYNSSWESFRAHSEFLKGKRYKHLLGESDYRVWAKGLIKAGYATDQKYAEKLIGLIEGLELYRFDANT